MSYPLSSTYFDALAWAADLHKDQVRKGSKSPYIAHLIGVSGLVIEFGGSETEAIAALLHDAVEDQGGQKTADEIKCRFGEDVAAIVLGCTDDKPDPGAAKRAWRLRKEEYVAHLRAVTNPSILLVSAADKLYNARAVLDDHRLVGEAIWDRFTGGRAGTLWYYRAVAHTFDAAFAELPDKARHAFPHFPELLTKLRFAVATLVRESAYLDLDSRDS